MAVEFSSEHLSIFPMIPIFKLGCLIGTKNMHV